MDNDKAKDGAGAGEQDSHEAGAGGGGEIDFGKLTLEEARATAARFYHEKAKANFEAEKKTARLKEKDEEVKRLSSRDAELKKLEDAQKTEAQKQAERNAQLEKDLAAERGARAHAQDMVAVMAGGVAEPYAEFLAGQLARARGTATDFDAKTFLAEQQKASPAFFLAQQQQGEGKEPPKKTAGGGPGAGTNNRAKASASLAEIEKEIEQANTQRNLDLSWRLCAERDRLLRELNE
jgi:hypothetical protein